MSVREGRIAGAPARLARVSFTGELGFEVNVPADFGESVLEAIWAEGEKVGAVAYGLDALHLLRAEKGYIIVGQETDGTVTPDDLGLGAHGRRWRSPTSSASARWRCPISSAPGASNSSACSPTIPPSYPTRARRSSPRRRRRAARPRSAMSPRPISARRSGASFALALVADGRGAPRRNAVRYDA